MIKIEFTEAEKQALNYQRYHHPHPRVQIYFDGEPINHHNRVWYRQHFSVVFSDFYLFERFLGLGRDRLDSQARDYLVQLQLNPRFRFTTVYFQQLLCPRDSANALRF